jgi:IS605 OrfB family transposase
MKTIKLPYKSSQDLTLLLKQYSNIVRYSYNRFLENKTEKEVRLLTKSLYNINELNSWIIQCGIKDALALKKRFKDQKVVFGGKNNLAKRSKNKISKEEFQLKRLTPINIQGEILQKGNRSFKLDILNNKIIFKLSRNNHIEFILPKLRNNIRNELIKLQQLNNVKVKQKGYTFSIRFDLKNIYISFEEFKKEPIKLNQNRYLGIDLNPDTIGISIKNNEQIICAKEFSLKPVFEKILNEKLGSNSDRMKYYQNKLRFETIEISKTISKLAKHYQCENVFVEDLHFKSSSTIKISNRKNKNLWKRILFVQNLQKRLNELGIKLHFVNPVYSSFIGNMQHDYTDAINASLEIGRRGFECKLKKNKTGFYPNLLTKHQWKEMAVKYESWKEFYLEVKNLKLKYRVSLNDVEHQFRVFEQGPSHKSMIKNYVFYD